MIACSPYSQIGQQQINILSSSVTDNIYLNSKMLRRAPNTTEDPYVYTDNINDMCYLHRGSLVGSFSSNNNVLMKISLGHNEFFLAHRNDMNCCCNYSPENV